MSSVIKTASTPLWVILSIGVIPAAVPVTKHSFTFSITSSIEILRSSVLMPCCFASSRTLALVIPGKIVSPNSGVTRVLSFRTKKMLQDDV